MAIEGDHVNEHARIGDRDAVHRACISGVRKKSSEPYKPCRQDL